MPLSFLRWIKLTWKATETSSAQKVRNLVSEPVFKTVFLTVNFQVIVIEKFGIPVKRYNNLEDTWSMR